MNTNCSIEPRLENFIALANDLSDNIGQIIKDNFEDGNITKGDSLARPFICFADSDMENVTLTIEYDNERFVGDIKVNSEDINMSIQIKVDESIASYFPEEIVDYLMEGY
jgi:hypothetical protein